MYFGLHRIWWWKGRAGRRRSAWTWWLPRSKRRKGKRWSAWVIRTWWLVNPLYLDCNYLLRLEQIAYMLMHVRLKLIFHGIRQFTCFPITEPAILAQKLSWPTRWSRYSVCWINYKRNKQSFWTSYSCSLHRIFVSLTVFILFCSIVFYVHLFNINFNSDLYFLSVDAAKLLF